MEMEGKGNISRKININELTEQSLAELLTERDDEEYNRLEVDLDGNVYVRYGKTPFGPADNTVVAIVVPTFAPGYGYCELAPNKPEDDLFLHDTVKELKWRWETKTFGYVN